MANTQSTQNKYFLAAIAILFVPISGLSIDIYVPSLPAVSRYFAVDKSLVQLTITFFMAGMGFMQLFAGPLSDSFGRRKPYLLANFLFGMVTLLIPFSNNIYLLLCLRFIQGVLAAIAIVPMRSVVVDLFEGRELYKMMNYMTMAWSLGPIIAPAIGGYLQHFFGWQANFYFLATYSFLNLLLAFFYMPETSKHFHAFHPIDILARYKRIVSHWHFFWGVINNGLLYSSLVLFGVIGPFLFQNVMHYSPIEFGHIALLMGAAWFSGTMTNRLLINVSLKIKATCCFWSMIIIAILMVIMNYFIALNAFIIIAPLIIFLYLGGIAFPNYFARNVSYFPESSASANSLTGAFIFFIAGFNTGIGTMIHPSSGLPLACAFFVLSCAVLCCHYLDLSKP